MSDNGSQSDVGSDDGQPPQHITASQQICGAAKLLGIDAVNEPDYLWLCENALLEDNNDEQKGFKNWKECKDKEGNTVDATQIVLTYRNLSGKVGSSPRLASLPFTSLVCYLLAVVACAQHDARG